MGAVSGPTPTHPSDDSIPAAGRLSTIPAELLIEIFSFVCAPPYSPGDPSRYNYPSFSTPLLLGKICGTWRDLAWSIPSLWNYIDIVLPVARQGIYAELLEDWINRSNDLPLTIIFRRDELGARSARGWGEQTLPLFHLIASEYRRWEHINLFIPHGFCTFRMNAMMSDKQLPRIRTAVLRGIGGSFFPETFLRDCPHLQDLTIHMTKFHSHTMPYTQLTQLTASEICMDDVISLLQQAPYLHTVLLADISAPATLPIPHIIVLDNLISLTVYNARALGYLLDSLRTPRLSYLFLDGCRVPIEVRSIEPFVQKHGPQLQSLTLGGFWEESIAPLLSHVARLGELRLRREGTRGTAAFQTSLAQSLASLPNLQCFTISGVAGPFDPLLDIIKHRWTAERDESQSNSVCNTLGPSRIYNVGFASLQDPEWRVKIKDCLKEQVHGGMVLHFTDWPSKSSTINFLTISAT